VPFGIEYYNDGTVRAVPEVEFAGDRSGKTLFGMPSFRSIELTSEGEPWLQTELGHRVDDGPFYLRYLTSDLTDERVI